MHVNTRYLHDVHAYKWYTQPSTARSEHLDCLYEYIKNRVLHCAYLHIVSEAHSCKEYVPPPHLLQVGQATTTNFKILHVLHGLYVCLHILLK
jgi:hypothetical protein